MALLLVPPFPLKVTVYFGLADTVADPLLVMVPDDTPVEYEALIDMDCDAVVLVMLLDFVASVVVVLALNE